MKKIIFKSFKYSAITLLGIMVCTYLVIELGGYVKTTSDERAQIKHMFTEAPALPQNFLDVYERVYPGSLNSTMWGYAFKERFGTVDFKYPVRDAAVTYGVPPSRGTFLNIVLMAFMIEDYATPQQCLQFKLAHFDFTHNTIGIEAASQYYFKKPLKDITGEQALELLVMALNPVVYNKCSSNPGKIKLFYERLGDFKNRYNSR